MTDWSTYRYIDINKWLHPEKQKIVFFLFDAAILIAIFSSLRASFTWAIETWYPIISAILCITAMAISNSMKETIFSRRDFFFPIVSCIAILCYEKLTTDGTILDYILCLLKGIVFMTLFRLNTEHHKHIVRMISKVLAILLGISMLTYTLYLLGVNLPHHSTTFGLYSYTSYYFFLLDDRNLFVLLPRFHAFFLEPGHMGTLIALLLACQNGNWKTWYNIILIIALLVSFSLAAYCLFLIVILLHLWINRKNIIRKIIIAVAAIAAIAVGTMNYNDGDNMLNQLIVMRLAINETGDDIEGNNRVEDWFQDEFNSYIKSSDIIFGRDMPKEMSGNAGYKVYLYEHGIIGMFLMYLFYILSMCKANDKRAFIAMLVLSSINLLIRAYPLWFAFYIPFYLMAYMPKPLIEAKK